jgi:hypothetical protein
MMIIEVRTHSHWLLFLWWMWWETKLACLQSLTLCYRFTKLLMARLIALYSRVISCFDY